MTWMNGSYAVNEFVAFGTNREVLVCHLCFWALSLLGHVITLDPSIRANLMPFYYYCY